MCAKYATGASKDPPHTRIYCVSVCQHSTIVRRWLTDHTCVYLSYDTQLSFALLSEAHLINTQGQICVCVVVVKLICWICAVIGCSVRVTHNGAMFLRNHRKFPAGTVQFYSDLINNVALVMISFPRGLFTHTHIWP